MVHALFQIHRAQRLACTFDPLAGRNAGINQRQFHVVQSRSARQQIESLENEADFLVPDARQLIVFHIADQLAVQVIQALGGRIQAANQVHQRRFAGTGRAHDGHVFAALDLDIDARDRVDLLVAHDVGLPEIVSADDDAVALELARRAADVRLGSGHECVSVTVGISLASRRSERAVCCPPSLWRCCVWCGSLW